MDTPRYLEPSIRADLDEKMVFVAGARQVGKTTLAQHVMATVERTVYLSWDNRDDRREIRAARWPGGASLVVLDELHKWRGWKGWLKGEYDTHRRSTRFLVTGSARLDVYRRGGDSLQGRYHHYRLHPFSCVEARHGENKATPPIVPGAELPVRKGSRDTLAALQSRRESAEPPSTRHFGISAIV